MLKSDNPSLVLSAKDLFDYHPSIFSFLRRRRGNIETINKSWQYSSLSPSTPLPQIFFGMTGPRRDTNERGVNSTRHSRETLEGRQRRTGWSESDVDSRTETSPKVGRVFLNFSNWSMCQSADGWVVNPETHRQEEGQVDTTLNWRIEEGYGTPGEWPLVTKGRTKVQERR